MDLELILQTAEECLALKPNLSDNPNGYDKAILGLTDNGQLVYSKEIMDERASFYTKKYAAIENKELMRKPIYTKPYDLGELKR
jgi:hypothetical protein